MKLQQIWSCDEASAAVSCTVWLNLWKLLPKLSFRCDRRTISGSLVCMKDADHMTPDRDHRAHDEGHADTRDALGPSVRLTHTWIILISGLNQQPLGWNKLSLAKSAHVILLRLFQQAFRHSDLWTYAKLQGRMCLIFMLSLSLSLWCVNAALFRIMQCSRFTRVCD